MKLLIGSIAIAAISGATILYLNDHWATGTLLLLIGAGISVRITVSDKDKEENDRYEGI